MGAGKVVGMVSRKDLGSWIDGAPTWMDYPGQDMGRPQHGPGSIARPFSRLVAFCLDWFIVAGLLWLLGGYVLPDVEQLVMDYAQLVVFWLYMVASVGFMGHTLGHLIMGMQVQSMDGKPAGWLTALIRQSLVMLILPVIIMDADQRGLHDRVRNTILVVIR